MSIERISATNFKSFDQFNVELGPYNVVVGANASGKTNFVSALRFLRDITKYDLNDAISLQGGTRYLRNLTVGASEDLSFEISMKPAQAHSARKKSRLYIRIRANEITYGFSLRFNKKGENFQIADDHLHVGFSLLAAEPRKTATAERQSLAQGRLEVRRQGKKVEVELGLPKGSPLGPEDIVPPTLRDIVLPPNLLICESPFYWLFSMQGPLFSDIAVFDFDPKLAKKAAPVAGRAELEESGRNLAPVLRNIAEQKGSKRKLTNLVRDLLPFAEGTGFRPLADKSMLFTLREKYFEKEYLPASLLSDGTIGVAALIAALFFEDKGVIAVEEPERNIHPSLISRIVSMMRDASRNKQIIVTTHNPEVVKHSGLESLLLVSRDKRGFSNISRPASSPGLEAFLRNEIGVEDLFIQNLLEA